MDRYRVKPGSKVSLAECDPDDRDTFDGSKEEGIARGVELASELEALQELLYAERKHKLLIVLQAMDTGGKDGTIRSVFDGVNPVGVKVASFKVPTPDERDRDFLWRVHKHVPGAGELVIFNRSHYEDVLVVRVHELAPPAIWKRRYEHINAFEKLLGDEGTTILKFFLHISKDEQRKRLQARLDDRDKLWKFAKGDLAERERWDSYMEAYEEALAKTSTDHAPWYIVPANRKWYRNLVVGTVIVDTLKKLDMQHPAAAPGLEDLVVE
ncbi:MAG: polyphosphate kinase 2 family protein [Planctomycetota bacterium]